MRLIFLISVLLFSCSEKPSAFVDHNLAVFDSSFSSTPADTNDQPVDSPFAEFIPDSFSILDSASGYLDADDHEDMLLILESPYEGIASDVPRPLLILLGNGNGQYHLAARNDSVVLNANQGGVFGDPYESITIHDGNFSIFHYGGSAWRWSREITFSYSREKQKWFLANDGGSSFHIAAPDSAEVYEINKPGWGKVEFEKYVNEN